MWILTPTLLILLLKLPYFDTGSWKKASWGSNPTVHQFYQLGDISEFLKTLNLNRPVPWECCESQWCMINISDLPLNPSPWGHLLWPWEES